MNKIGILIILYLLNGCIGLAVKKGYYLERSWDKISEMERESITKSRIIDIGDNYMAFIGLSEQCSSFGFYGFVLPVVPYWNSKDCSVVNINISFNQKDNEIPEFKNLYDFREKIGSYNNIRADNDNQYKENLKIFLKDEMSGKIYNVLNYSGSTYSFSIKKGELESGFVFLQKESDEVITIPFYYGRYFYIFL